MFLFERQLTGFPAFQFFAGPAALLANSIQSMVKGSINEDEKVAVSVPASFEHHGGIQNGQFRRVFRRLNPGLDDTVDFRVNDSFQRLKGVALLRLIAEDQCCQAFSINLFAVENRVTKRQPELINSLRKSEDLVPDLVSINHFGREVVRKSACNRALAGTNSADNAHNRRLTEI